MMAMRAKVQARLGAIRVSPLGLRQLFIVNKLHNPLIYKNIQNSVYVLFTLFQGQIGE